MILNSDSRCHDALDSQSLEGSLNQTDRPTKSTPGSKPRSASHSKPNSEPCRNPERRATGSDSGNPKAAVPERSPSERRRFVEWTPGMRISGTQYRVIDRVGRGGMGDVFEVEHVAMRRRCAMKTIASHLNDHEDLAGRLSTEAIALARLKHPSIVEVYDLGLAGDGRAFMVMELLDGATLKTVLTEHGRLSPRTSCEITVQLLAGLDAAHALGVIHRDVKPDNIFLCTDGSVKLLDFGVAKVIHSLSNDTVDSRRHGAVGTPRYMSPEQTTGEPLDCRSDIYSTGLVLWEMIAGVPAFRDTDIVRLLRAKLRGLPPLETCPHISVPKDICQIVDRACNPVPSLRYQSAREFYQAIRKAIPTVDPRDIWDTRSYGSNPEVRRPIRPRSSDYPKRPEHSQYEEDSDFSRHSDSSELNPPVSASDAKTIEIRTGSGEFGVFVAPPGVFPKSIVADDHTVRIPREETIDRDCPTPAALWAIPAALNPKRRASASTSSSTSSSTSASTSASSTATVPAETAEPSGLSETTPTPQASVATVPAPAPKQLRFVPWSKRIPGRLLAASIVFVIAGLCIAFAFLPTSVPESVGVAARVNESAEAPPEAQHSKTDTAAAVSPGGSTGNSATGASSGPSPTPPVASGTGTLASDSPATTTTSGTALPPLKASGSSGTSKQKALPKTTARDSLPPSGL